MQIGFEKNQNKRDLAAKSVFPKPDNRDYRLLKKRLSNLHRLQINRENKTPKKANKTRK